MNAEAITNEVMERIQPYLGINSQPAEIRYAILRSHASVISGLIQPSVDTDGRGVPTAQYTEGAPRRDEASPPPERTIAGPPVTVDGMRRAGYSPETIINERLNRLESHVARCCAQGTMKDERDALRGDRDEALDALRRLQAWSLDTNRGPFVPDELSGWVQRVLNQYATDHP